jgi:nicotinamide-nucleotide adenylyltransferase
LKLPVSLFIGRFQPLHKGHVFALRHIAARSARVLVVVGSAQEKNTRDNPYSAKQRELMLHAVLRKEGLARKCKIFLLRDIPDDEKWVAHVGRRVPHYDVCHSNNALVLRLMRAAGKKVARVPLLSRAKYRGEKIRRKMRAGKEWESRVPASVRKRISPA